MTKKTIEKTKNKVYLKEDGYTVACMDKETFEELTKTEQMDLESARKQLDSGAYNVGRKQELINKIKRLELKENEKPN